MTSIEEISTGVSNYYGSVVFCQKTDGKYYMELENYNGFDEIEISKEFFDMARKEFNHE